MDTILIMSVILIFLLCIYQCRNWWVYRQRTKLLYKNENEYDKLIDYDLMIRKFWVWDVDKLKKEK